MTIGPRAFRCVGVRSQLMSGPPRSIPSMDVGWCIWQCWCGLVMVVEAAGVEPASEDASDRTSTRVGTLFRVSRSPAAAGLRAQQADYVSISMRQRVRRSSLIVSVLRSYRRKLRDTVVAWFYPAARATAVLSFAVAGLPIFTWPWAPRRAIRSSTSSSKPVRPQVFREGRTMKGVRGSGQASALEPRETELG